MKTVFNKFITGKDDNYDDYDGYDPYDNYGENYNDDSYENDNYDDSYDNNGYNNPPAVTNKSYNTPEVVAKKQDKVSLLMSSPTAIKEACTVINSIKSGKIVIMSLERADEETAQRIIDFVSGAMFALGGEISKASEANDNIFLVAPSSVEISGRDRDEIGKSASFFGTFGNNFS